MKNITAEERICLLKIALKTTSFYNKRVYKLYAYAINLLMKLKCGEEHTRNNEDAISELEDLAMILKKRINKFEEYQTLINRLSAEV